MRAGVFEGIDGRVGGQVVVAGAAKRLADGDIFRLRGEVPDGDIERTDRVHRRAAPAVPLRARVHFVPEAAWVVHPLPGDDAGQPLGPLVVGRHLDQGLHEFGRRVALADAHEPVIAMNEDDDVPIAALEAVVVGLRVL